MIESTMPENPAIEGDERITDIATVLCAAYLVMGSIDRGLAVSTRMLPVAESINDAVGSAALTSLIGAALHITGAWEEARDYIQGAGEQFAALGPSATSVRFIPVLAECLIREGRWSEARQHLDAAVEASRSMRAYHPERTAITFLGLIDVLEGRTDAAIRRLEPLLAHDPGWVYAVTLPSTLAGAYLEAGDVERARALAQRAVSEARRMGAWLWAVEALRVLGIAEMQLKNYDLAARTLGEGLQRARVIPFPYAEARSLHAFGLLDQQRGDVKSSHAKFSEALAIVERMGATWQAERFRATLRT
jgi:tetratricopeptide (TPR) repeat protein